MASLLAPKVNCISVLPNGNITITWEKVLDPTGIFNSYKVYVVSGSSTTLLQSIANINQLSYTHTGINGNNSSYSYLIGTTCSSAVTNLSDTISSIKLTVNNPNNGLAILNWNKIFKPNNSPTASNWYKIYQEYPAGTWTLIDSTQYGNEYYRDTITICDDSVNYRITNSNTNCISTSSIDGSNFKDILPPKPPIIKSVTVDTTTNRATISWNKGYPEDTEGYIILKRIGGAWIPIDTIYGINNTTYNYGLSTAGNGSECYGIAAFDSCWYGTPLTPNTSAMGIFHCSIFLTSTYDVCDKSVNLTWNAYTNWASGISNYEIYYKINGNNEKLYGQTSSTSIKVENISPDSSYCFIIKATSGNLKDSAISNKECIVTTYPFISDTNYLQTATVSNQDQIQIKIYTPLYNTISGYNIERSSNGGAFNYIGYAPKTINPITYTDNSVNTELFSYSYKAIPIDSCGNLTEKESNIGETIFLTTISQSGNYTNNLSWNHYQIWDGSIKEYEIYRKLGNNAPVLIATVSSTSNTYEDDISSFYSSSDDGKFCYYIEAVENTNQYGFAETSKSNISCVSPDHLIYIPNSITPNGDGVNDEFKPIVGFANLTTYSLKIFNRLGNEIFSTTDINESWNGTHNGKVVQSTIYVYVVLVEDSQGKPIQKSGTIYLLK